MPESVQKMQKKAPIWHILSENQNTSRDSPTDLGAPFFGTIPSFPMKEYHPTHHYSTYQKEIQRLPTTAMDDAYVEMGQFPTKAYETTRSPGNPHANDADQDNDDDDDDDDTTSFLPTRGWQRQWQAFGDMAWPYFRDEGTARRGLVVLLVLTVCNSLVRVLFSYLARDFWTALSAQEQDTFTRVVQRFVVACLVLTPVTVLYRYQRQQLAIAWREWMTHRVLHLYYDYDDAPLTTTIHPPQRRPRVYYELERMTTVGMDSNNSDTTSDATKSSSPPHQKRRLGVDNPDQRITEDIRSFTEYSLSFFLTVLTACMDLVCFSIVLFTILPRLFVTILVFATTGTVATIVIGRVLIQLNYERLQTEANFRFALVRIREHAEQIAFLAGERVELRHVQACVAQVIGNRHALNRAMRNLDFFTTSYFYLTWIAYV